MSLRRDLRPAFRAVERRPALLVVGFVVGVVQVAAWVAGDALAGLAGPLAARFGGPVLGMALVTFTLPLWAAVYVPALEPPAGVRATLARAARVVWRTYRRVLVADVAAAVVAVLCALAAGVAWFVASTAVRYGRYAATDAGAPHAMESVFIGMGAMLLGLALGRLGAGFADVFALFEDEPPEGAWRWSLRFAATRPVSLLGYGVVVVTLQGGPGVAGDLVARGAGDGAGAAAVGAVVAVALAGVATTLAATLHAVYFDRTVRPAVAAGPVGVPNGVRWSTVAAAGLLVTAAVVGAGAVRTADLRPLDPPTRPLPEDPQDAYEVAASNTADTSFRYVVRGRNLSDPDATFTPFTRAGIDYRDRQLYVFLYGDDPGQKFGSYFAEGTIAPYGPTGQWSGLAVREAGNWTVVAFAGWGLAQPQTTFGNGAAVPSPDVNWTVVEQNASTLVLRVDDTDAIRTALHPSSFTGMGENMTDDSYLVVRVDRERGVVNGADFRLHSRDTGKDFSYRMRLEEVGTADVERPAKIGPRTPLEWFWDVVYY